MSVTCVRDRRAVIKGPATPARRGLRAPSGVLAAVLVIAGTAQVGPVHAGAPGAEQVGRVHAGAPGAAQVGPVHAGAPGAGSRWSFGILAGSVQPDGDLADYQWRTVPSAAWGVRALAGVKRFSGGVRLWNTRARQDIGAATPATVRGTSVELIGRGRLLNVGASQVLATASGGRLHLAYDPDRIEVGGGSGGADAVKFGPIDEWIVGAGLALEQRVAGAWSVGFEVERRFFGLDTAHRSGETIVERREMMGDWNARVELVRLVGTR